LANDPTVTEAERKKCIQQIRQLAEKVDPLLQIKQGVIEIMLAALKRSDDDEKMWAMFVIQLLVKKDQTAVATLQNPETLPVLETLLTFTLDNRRSNQATLVIQRCLDTFLTLSNHDMAQGLLLRPDVFRVRCIIIIPHL